MAANALLKNGKVIARSFAQASSIRSLHNDKVYELRTYSIKPKNFKEFYDLSVEYMHLRTNHSKLVGYWTSEIGGIFDMVHIWEYDNLQHRAKVRQAMSGDQEWSSKYISKVFPMMERLENVLLKLDSKSSLEQTNTGGVYEICCTEKPLKELPNTKGDGQLLGTFSTLIGSLNTSYQLWYHKSLDALVSSADLRTYGTHSTKSRLLLPTPWSPMK